MQSTPTMPCSLCMWRDDKNKYSFKQDCVWAWDSLDPHFIMTIISSFMLLWLKSSFGLKAIAFPIKGYRHSVKIMTVWSNIPCGLPKAISIVRSDYQKHLWFCWFWGVSKSCIDTNSYGVVRALGLCRSLLWAKEFAKRAGSKGYRNGWVLMKGQPSTQPLTPCNRSSRQTWNPLSGLLVLLLFVPAAVLLTDLCLPSDFSSWCTVWKILPASDLSVPLQPWLLVHSSALCWLFLTDWLWDSPLPVLSSAIA